jgi:serine/threonine-protein kinase
VATVTLPPESGSNSSTGSFVEEKLTPLALPAVPGYRLIRELGRGGMGVVYLAERQTDGSMVALKTIVPAVAGSPAQVKRFLREACILFQLRHRNIVAFRDMGEANGMLFFAMEYVDGTNTGRLVKEHGPLSVRLAVRILSQVLSALEYAHKVGFVHRDIKPSNILLSRSGQRPAIKLADFGLARVYQESELSGLSLEGTAGGTIPFMAPEQITHFRQAQPAADQYSAAATLYNLLTGKYLFDFEEAEIPPVALVLQQDQIPLRQRRPDLPEALAQVIHRALSQDPDDRFSNVSAFRQALLPFGR